MTKRFLLTTLCFFVPLYLSIASGNFAEINKENSNSIVLKGSLITNTNGAKSTPVLPAVTATLYETYLKVDFNEPLGYLTVTVVNQQNFPVYQQTVNATAGSSLVIDTRSWSNGTYTLLITNTNGGYLEGQFTLNR